MLLVLLGLILMSGIASHYLAKKQGRPAGFWGVMGILFSPFTPFVLLFLKPKK